MMKKTMAIGVMALAMGVVLPSVGDDFLINTAIACEEGREAEQGTPGGIPYSKVIAYNSGIINERIHSYVDGKLLMDAQTYSVTLAPEEIGKYPVLQAALEKLTEENHQNMLNKLVSWQPDLQELYKHGKDNGMYQENVPFAYELTYSGQRADSTVFSCVGTEYVFLGGAHPVTYYKGVVIDSESGKRLKLQDVLKTTDGFAEIVAKETEKEILDRHIPMDRITLVNNIQKLIDDQNLQFALTADGMKVLFGSYAMGIYAYGTFEIDIPQAEYFNICNPKYIFYGNRPRG
ncbi:MAG: DUF3298 and DUF4163 domain-containing protein [Anaerovibrio sp.]|uniref:DUF3298 and DUF4163 domain-containing protein n=1 Tax=Anaerovibrio sp. TaxID=1872532 RepID=UPI0025E109A6|nr:DUF3298 and DUF4163 domain-containing protein [Anaerovibrio sp.]MCR5177048.1 DUF3298 and DUF4163 domain-containing protein [Anaerovibrio sp.]